MEWTRRELKENAKTVFKKYYWKMVLVSLILTLVCGGGSGTSSYIDSSSQTMNTIENDYSDNLVSDVSDIDTMDDTDVSAGESIYDDAEAVRESVGPSGAMIAGIVVGVLIVVVIALAIGFVVSAFVLNPLMVGIYRFYIKSYEEEVQIREIAFGFDHSYMNVVKTMFLRDVYTLLWALLLIIPGIVKYYEYRMLPYIMGEQPQLDSKEAFRLSKELMRGQKWKTFVLDLSFLGWNLLSICTLGILSIFYVNPYANMTLAGLYRKLSRADEKRYTEHQPEVYPDTI